MNVIKYATTCSVATINWPQGEGDRDNYRLSPPAPIPPKEEGNWVLMGPGTTVRCNGYEFLAWTWADVGTVAKAAAAFGAGFDAALVEPGLEETEQTTDPEKPDLPVAQEGDHRCGVHSPDGYQCEFAAHDGIMHYNKACGTFVTQLPPPVENAEETEPAPLL